MIESCRIIFPTKEKQREIVQDLSKYVIIHRTPRERSENMASKPPKKSAPSQEQWDWFESHLTPEIRNRLYQEAYRILRNRSDAEDILQDAIHIGISNLSHLRSDEKLFPWMFTIVRREAMRHLKREKKLTDIRYAFLLVENHYEIGIAPDRLVITKEEVERLHCEIDRLDSPEKEILLLKLRTTKSLKEIAADLGLNYHTTRSKYTRTCHLIKHRLTDEGGDGRHEKK